jgi:hypothetical protein
MKKNINDKLDSLQNFILKQYEKDLPQLNQKEWLQNTIHQMMKKK